jgi:hypothetical protein
MFKKLLKVAVALILIAVLYNVLAGEDELEEVEVETE